MLVAVALRNLTQLDLHVASQILLHIGFQTLKTTSQPLYAQAVLDGLYTSEARKANLAVRALLQQTKRPGAGCQVRELAAW